MGIIRTRVSDELEKQIQERIEKLKENARGGMEVTMSTVIRYSLEKYLEEQTELDQGVITLKFNVDKLSVNDLKRLERVAEELSDIFSSGYKDTMELMKNSFNLDQSIKYKLYKEEKNNIENELTEEEKEILKKYPKNKEV